MGQVSFCSQPSSVECEKRIKERKYLTRPSADIVKALALGAKMVLIGRPYIYGLALAGEGGVSHVIRALLGELDLTLHLAGIPSVSRSDLNRDVLVRE